MLAVSHHKPEHEATSMDDPTSLLFGLDEFRVVDVERVAEKVVQVVIETVDVVARCPDCGAPSSRIKDRPRVQIKDLPVSGQRVLLCWRKRRLLCLDTGCPRSSFTETTTAIPPRARLTVRLREQLARAIAGSNRAVLEVAAEHDVSWHTAHSALVTAAARWLPAPPPTRVLGVDETRARRVRWLLEPAGWRRSEPWLTSFVDADTTGGRSGVLLGLAPGRSGACVRGWLAAQSAEFRAGIELVVIDPSAPYASGIRAALPHAHIAVDHWHLVRLANEMVTEVRQRVARERHDRRGIKADPVWAHRRMLLTAGDRLSRRQLDRLCRVLAVDDPTDEVGAAWGCKELLRQLLAEQDPERIRHRLWRFYDACAMADMAETTRLAATIETWWPAIVVALAERVTNARTEGFNRIIKQVKRVGCGFRNIDNYQRRIMAHIAVTRPRRDAA
jgi:transposase